MTLLFFFILSGGVGYGVSELTNDPLAGVCAGFGSFIGLLLVRAVIRWSAGKSDSILGDMFDGLGDMGDSSHSSWGDHGGCGGNGDCGGGDGGGGD